MGIARKTTYTISIMSTPLRLVLSTIAMVVAPFASYADSPDTTPPEQPATAILARPAAKDELIAITERTRGLSIHKTTYLLPYTWSNLYFGAQSEMEFQISAKQQLFGLPLYFGYTQKSYWQAYHSAASSPFRETNYNPEIFYRTQQHEGALGPWRLDIGFEHESNGQSGLLSRSWNRAYIMAYLPARTRLWHLKVWYRIPENIATDDNPNIHNYYGWSELGYKVKFAGEHMIHLMLRGNLMTGKGGTGLNYSAPIYSNEQHLVLRLWHGYGESLIDHEKLITRIGIGIIFAR